MERAVEDCDIVVHLAAFHGGYTPPPTDETRFDVNVVGTFRLLQACLKKGIRRIVWASSIAAASKEGFYPITKVLGEDLCEYYHLTHGFSIGILRYGAFTPCDLLTYGERILGIGVDIRDCVGATICAIERLQSGMELFGRFTVLPDHRFTEEKRQSLASEYPILLGAINPVWADLVAKYKIKIPPNVVQYDISSTQTILGFHPSFNFITFLEELEHRDKIGAITISAPRWYFEQGCHPPEGVIWPECLNGEGRKSSCVH
jgi:nucleoside-diphosphate-sugar epimerase